jgi:FkbM family methyltransferase
MPSQLRSYLKQNMRLYRLALNWRLSGLGRVLHRLLLSQGATFRCTRSGIVVCHKNMEILFGQDQLNVLLYSLRDLPWFESRLIFTDENGRLVADCRGRRRYRLPWNESTIVLPAIPESADFVTGYLLRGRPTEGSTVFDAGAYCGETTLSLARIVGPRGHVVAFEPDADNRRWLDLNIKESGFTNITVIDRGLWKETTTLRFSPKHGTDAAICLTDASQSEGDYEIPTISFQEACERVGAVPEFVKMDIEGAEVEVIEASVGFLAKHRIAFAIASYHMRNGKPTSEIIEPLLRSAGYTVETGYPTHQTTWARNFSRT